MYKVEWNWGKQRAIIWPLEMLLQQTNISFTFWYVVKMQIAVLNQISWYHGWYGTVISSIYLMCSLCVVFEDVRTKMAIKEVVLLAPPMLCILYYIISYLNILYIDILVFEDVKFTLWAQRGQSRRQCCRYVNNRPHSPMIYIVMGGSGLTPQYQGILSTYYKKNREQQQQQQQQGAIQRLTYELHPKLWA